MTITYTAEVATCRGFGCFLKLLIRWRGSIYKLVWLDLVTFLLLYYTLNMTYRFALNDQQKMIFEGVAQYCYNYSNLIPLSFVLGFYVQVVMTRWWNQYISIPWPDPIAVFVSAHVHGQDERGRVMRRTIMRYVCLCLTMVLTNIAPRVKKRFPSLDNFIESGLLNENEKQIIESLNKSFPRHSKHWLPIVWAASIVTRARKEGRIRDDFAVKTVIDELNKFRGQCGVLISYDTISVPLVYTQVVTLAVYSYFLCSVMAQQWTENKKVAESTYLNNIDLYFPVFTTLQLSFYMGWLKVAESLINHFGEDDDDFEVNWMVDRNLQVSYLIVDEMHHEHPELLKDQYWDEVLPNELPYTIATERFRENHPEPSTAKIEVPKASAMTSAMSGVRITDPVGNTTTDAKQQHSSGMASMQAVSYKFQNQPQTPDEEGDDAASGIHFIAGNCKGRNGSSPSLVSLSGTISRVNTVASVLKRMISKDEPATRTGANITQQEEGQRMRLPGSISSSSIAGNLVTSAKLAGSMRITDQVIEEVDEQLTITSQRGSEMKRPHMRELFQTNTNDFMTVSEGVGPEEEGGKRSLDRTDSSNGNVKLYMRTHSNVEPSLFPPGGVDGLLSSSAPTTEASPLARALHSPRYEHLQSPFGSKAKLDSVMDVTGGSQDLRKGSGGGQGEGDMAKGPDGETDEFEKLRVEREKERLERQSQLLARSVSNAPSGEGITPVIAATILTPPVSLVGAETLQPPPTLLVPSLMETTTTMPGEGENESDHHKKTLN